MPVLPWEPVIASTTHLGQRGRRRGARGSPSAAVTSSTTTVGSSVGRLPSTADGARGAGRRGEVVAVDPLAGDGDEEAAGLRGAGVDERAAGDGRVAVGRAPTTSAISARVISIIGRAVR